MSYLNPQQYYAPYPSEYAPTALWTETVRFNLTQGYKPQAIPQFSRPDVSQRAYYAMATTGTSDTKASSNTLLLMFGTLAAIGLLYIIFRK